MVCPVIFAFCLTFSAPDFESACGSVKAIVAAGGPAKNGAWVDGNAGNQRNIADGEDCVSVVLAELRKNELDALAASVKFEVDGLDWFAL